MCRGVCSKRGSAVCVQKEGGRCKEEMRQEVQCKEEARKRQDEVAGEVRRKRGEREARCSAGGSEAVI